MLYPIELQGHRFGDPGRSRTDNQNLMRIPLLPLSYRIVNLDLFYSNPFLDKFQ